MKYLSYLSLSLIFCLSCNKRNPVIDNGANQSDLLIGLSLQLNKDFKPGLEGHIDGLNIAVKNGVNFFGMAPEWNMLEPVSGSYALQDNLLNPLQLLDQNKTKVNSFVLVIKMIDTNRKPVPQDLENVSFGDDLMINRYSQLLNQILTSDPSIDRISHILIGNEIDGFLSATLSQIEPFKVFYKEAVKTIHQLKPKIKVGTIITYNSTRQNHQLFNTMKEVGDFICYTYYPDDTQTSLPWQMRSPLEIKGDIDWMVENANNKPIAFTEIGYTSSGQNASSETLQAQFVNEMFNALAVSGHTIATSKH